MTVKKGGFLSGLLQNPLGLNGAPSRWCSPLLHRAFEERRQEFAGASGAGKGYLPYEGKKILTPAAMAASMRVFWSSKPAPEMVRRRAQKGSAPLVIGMTNL